MELFNPEKAVITLKNNAIDIEALGNEILSAYHDVIMAKAEYADAEAIALGKYFDRETKIRISEMPSWIKLQTAKQRKDLDIAELKLKKLKQKYDVVIEVSNAVKMAFRIQDGTISNLKLEP